MVMFNNKYFAIFYFILFQFSIIAQITDSLESKESASNCGLSFGKEIQYRLQDSLYTDVIQLFNLGDKAQAMQFRILLNKATDDSTVLILKDIQKGSDLSDPSWLMDFNVIKGSVEENGASKYEIYVVLYNLNYDNGLLPGDYQNLFNVNYRTAKLFAFNGDIKSSIKISHAEASTSNGSAIDIKPVRDKITIIVKEH